jgi:hypothetical protein
MKIKIKKTKADITVGRTDHHYVDIKQNYTIVYVKK